MPSRSTSLGGEAVSRVSGLSRLGSGFLMAVIGGCLALGDGIRAIAAGGTDWPMFRGGPSLIGVANTVLPAEPVLLWSFKTEGPVKSSPAVVNGTAYVGSGDQSVYAIDLATGKKRWSFKTQAEIESSPLVLDGRVYIGSSDAWVYALDATNGTLVWKYETGDKVVSSPNWIKSPKAGAGANANWIIVGSNDYKLHCVDAASGKTNWVYETGNYINGCPAIANGQTVFGGCDAILHVLSLTDGAKVKEIEAGAYIAASVALDRDRAYFGHYENEFLCIDIAKGTNLWTYRDRGFAYFSSPAVTPDRVVFGGRDKRLHCADRETGKVLWTFGTRGKVDSSPVVAGDRVVVGSDDGRVYIVSLKDGSEIWNYEIGQPVASSPAVVDGRFLVGSDDGSLYCFGTKK